MLTSSTLQEERIKRTFLCSATREQDSRVSSNMSYSLRLFLLLVAVAAISAQSRKGGGGKRPKEEDGDVSDECPELDGYFPDAEYCDKYYACNNGAITEKICPDGMVFNDVSSEYDKCDLPFNIDCGHRTKLQEPQPSKNCPRKHGYFAHEDKTICDKFYYCVDGQFNMITCPDGLVYNDKTGICTWPDEAKKKGCSSKDVFQFDCPKVSEQVALTHPRYADPEDCQFFYVCINGHTPRRNGCKLGQVFNDATMRCDWPRKVPECKDWYKGQLTDEQLEALENPPRPKTNADGKRKTSRRPSQIRDAAA